MINHNVDVIASLDEWISHFATPPGDVRMNNELIEVRKAVGGLLEALKAIVSDYEFCKLHPSFGDRGEQYAEKAREAIARATGEKA